MPVDDTASFAGQILYQHDGWVEVIRAATLKECAHAAAIAYQDRGRKSIGVRVIRLVTA
jgi:hypothetical protein